jgi:hypothetical protein
MVGKGGLPPRVECHSTQAGASHPSQLRLSYLNASSVAGSSPTVGRAVLVTQNQRPKSKAQSSKFKGRD